MRPREESASGGELENFRTRGGFRLGPHAGPFNEACWLLAGFPLAAPPGHSLSLGRMFLGTGVNLLVGGGLLLHTVLYRASAKLLNY